MVKPLKGINVFGQETTTDILAIFDMIYPVGSIYWSNKPNNPSEYGFVGTWVQIKDRFVLAAGDIYSVNSTGGSASVTLTTSNMPSHNHTFTGTYDSVSTDGSHGHSVSVSGSSGYESDHESFSWSGSHRHTLFSYGGGESDISSVYGGTLPCSNKGAYNANAQYLDYPYFRNTPRPESPYISDTSITVSGTCTGDHYHNINISGSASDSGSHSHTYTPKGLISTEGSGSSFSIMPPYTVRYCWERTA